MSQQQSLSAPEAQHDWTFNSPNVIDYQNQNKVPKTCPVSGLPLNQQFSADAYAVPNTDPGLVDPTNQEYGWGSGFEQAMDIALYGTDGLQQGGLDNWCMGDAMAPFGFPGDMAGVQQW